MGLQRLAPARFCRGVDLLASAQSSSEIRTIAQLWRNARRSCERGNHEEFEQYRFGRDFTSRIVGGGRRRGVRLLAASDQRVQRDRESFAGRRAFPNCSQYRSQLRRMQAFPCAVQLPVRRGDHVLRLLVLDLGQQDWLTRVAAGSSAAPRLRLAGKGSLAEIAASPIASAGLPRRDPARRRLTTPARRAVTSPWRGPQRRRSRSGWRRCRKQRGRRPSGRPSGAAARRDTSSPLRP